MWIKGYIVGGVIALISWFKVVIETSELHIVDSRQVAVLGKVERPGCSFREDYTYVTCRFAILVQTCGRIS